MNRYSQQSSLWEQFSTATPVTQQTSLVIRQTYLLFGLAVFSAIGGGYIGATSETLARFFSGWIGWIAALLLLNVVPRIALAVRHNHQLGVAALVLDGFVAGIAVSPLLWVARLYAPVLIVVALFITGFVFVGVTLYVMASHRTFSAPRGLLAGLFFSVLGAVILNSFLHIGIAGILIAIAIGALGVFTLVYATSNVLRSAYVDSPIPGALMLFAGVFNIFVAALNILLRVLGGGGRRS
jgi:modulator of FtsH protease